MKKEQGITLLALVITVIILLILAGITLSLTIGQNGIITKAQQSGRTQKIAEIKEKISLAILDAETEATIRGEKLEQEQIKDIVSEYGELQEDRDTIKLKEPKDEEIKISDLYNGETSSTGSYTENKEKIAQLEETIGELQETVDSLNTQITELEKIQATGNATEGQVLTGYTFSNVNGVGLTGTMPNRGTLNWNPSSSTSYAIPAGFYSGGTISTQNAYTAGYNAGRVNGNLSYVTERELTNVTNPTVSFSVNPGSKYLVEVMYINNQVKNSGHLGSNMTISNASSVTFINRRQQPGYDSVYAGRCCYTFVANSSTVSIYFVPNTSNSYKWNMVMMLFLIS